jgi:hypothetical protein
MSMNKKPGKQKEEILVVKSRPVEPADERLNRLFEDLESKSLDTLDSAARQIITLCTTLLGAFFAILALKDAPAYLQYFEVKVLAGIALGGFMVAIVFGLATSLPRHYRPAAGDLTDMRETLETMRQHKRKNLFEAEIAFGSGILAMLLAALDIIIFHI